MQGYTLINFNRTEMEPPTLGTEEWDPGDLEELRVILARNEASWRASYTIECTKQEARNGLAVYFREIARWSNTEEFPDDKRIAKSAASLERVAAYCLTLSVDHHLLARLFAMPRCFLEGGCFDGPWLFGVWQHDDVASRCRLDGDIHPATWLSVWMDVGEWDYASWIKRMNENFALDRVEEVIE